MVNRPSTLFSSLLTYACGKHITDKVERQHTILRADGMEERCNLPWITGDLSQKSRHSVLRPHRTFWNTLHLNGGFRLEVSKKVPPAALFFHICCSQRYKTKKQLKINKWLIIKIIIITAIWSHRILWLVKSNCSVQSSEGIRWECARISFHHIFDHTDVDDSPS